MENKTIKLKTQNTNVETNMLNSKKSPSSEKKVPSASRVIEQKIVGLSYFSLAYTCGNKENISAFCLIPVSHKNYNFQGYCCKIDTNMTEQHFKQLMR